MINLDPGLLAQGDQGRKAIEVTIQAMVEQHRDLITTHHLDPTTAWALEAVRIQAYYTELNEPTLAIAALATSLATAIATLATHTQENPTP